MCLFSKAIKMEPVSISPFLNAPTASLVRPWVWLPADHRMLGDDGDLLPFLVLGDKYAVAVRRGANAQPVVFALAEVTDIPNLLASVDGVMLTGSPSNVHPSHFGESVANPALPLDPARDTLTLALVKACIAHAVPLLGICRGFQEINVALGGSLQQAVQEQPGFLDHRGPNNVPLEVSYGSGTHSVQLEPGSVFAQWAGSDSAMVNSLHGQGIGRLAPGLKAMAHAPDGLVEAVQIENAPAFAYAVQWHPEWRCWENPFYAAIFNAFGKACAERRAQRFR